MFIEHNIFGLSDIVNTINLFVFQGPSLDEVRVANPMSRRPYLERINVAYSYASAELLDLIVNKVIYCSEPVETT